MFKTNVGGIDRVLRIVVGLALIAWWYFAPGMGLRWLPLVLGIVALGTGLMSTCPLYSLIGLNTCPMKKS
ncbi:Protein of unknown function (DUF2892) [Defluviimonas denitrificans]|jgi:hypothetical protein|uniref:Inner membrane protein YgaP-like transmembrane domain-containing protein n=1 Tax=Albidovulum denitrificans TaxID=404881 RepID=A0A2S8SAB9_9RHOB|nr:DUF2892 domain-containing protein [Defluviimonas denitrificans]PQV57658.1 Protein of unknown function (DUF2892) [Defluviimonas denitrificans]